MLIYLNGTSSAGKSSIAQAMVQQSTLAFVHIEADNIFAPDRRVKTSSSDDSHIYFLSTSAMVSNALKAGKNVIWEDPLFHPEQLIYEVSYLGVKDIINQIYLINVQCDLDVCKSREIARKDRGSGFAAIMHSYVYKYMPICDVEVDTSSTSPEDNARIILDFIAKTPQPTAFDRHLQGVEKDHLKEVANKLRGIKDENE